MLTHHRARLEWRREDRVVRFGGIIRDDKNKFPWAASSVAPLFIVCPPPSLSLSPEKGETTGCPLDERRWTDRSSLFLSEGGKNRVSLPLSFFVCFFPAK